MTRRSAPISEMVTARVSYAASDLLFLSLCVFTLMTSGFDCVVTLATAPELIGGSEQNPAWEAFLAVGSPELMVALKCAGMAVAASIMWAFRRDRLRFAVMIPVATAHLWLLLTLNFGVQGEPFSFDFSDPFGLIKIVIDRLFTQP